ncbi:MAG TPA: hypothetical protein VGG84_12460 [Gemmatimonadaceae bacterium]|jgi:hypothetical protein
MKHRPNKVRAQGERLHAIRQDLIRRIRPICADMPDDLFFELIERMAAVQLKYELEEPRVAG